MFDIGIEPRLEPPEDDRGYCRTPDCDTCRISIALCPGIDPDTNYNDDDVSEALDMLEEIQSRLDQWEE